VTRYRASAAKKALISCLTCDGGPIGPQRRYPALCNAHTIAPSVLCSVQGKVSAHEQRPRLFAWDPFGDPETCGALWTIGQTWNAQCRELCAHAFTEDPMGMESDQRSARVRSPNITWRS